MPLNPDKLMQAVQLLARAQRVVCLTGAGVSAESGIATFRDAQTGLWSKFDPQQLASQAGFAANPGSVWRWYIRRLEMVEQAQPNSGHVALARLGPSFPSFTLFTQNIDNLHERAGSQAVLHVHGTINSFRCNVCAAKHILRPEDRAAEMPPACVHCGGLIRPDVVWFGEDLPRLTMARAWRATEICDVMLTVGTSGVVYPVAELPFQAQQYGATVIDMNLERTPISEIADVFVEGPSGETLPQLVEQLLALR